MPNTQASACVDSSHLDVAARGATSSRTFIGTLSNVQASHIAAAASPPLTIPLALLNRCARWHAHAQTAAQRLVQPLRRSHVLQQLRELGLVDLAVAIAVRLLDELLHVGIGPEARAQVICVDETVICKTYFVSP